MPGRFGVGLDRVAQDTSPVYWWPLQFFGLIQAMAVVAEYKVGLYSSWSYQPWWQIRPDPVCARRF